MLATEAQPNLRKLFNRRLESAKDFPKDAPILIITDGYCDYLTVHRPHAYLLPEGGRLPFDTRAPIFHFGAD